MFHTEREVAKGFADIFLEPLLVRYPGIRHGYVIEIKYLRRGESADETRIAEAARQAETRLRQYLGDEGLARQYPSVGFTGLAIVFRGWEMVRCDAVDVDR